MAIMEVNVLVIKCSTNPNSRSNMMLKSYLRQVTADLSVKNIECKTVEHDFSATPPPHFSRSHFQAFKTPRETWDMYARNAHDLCLQYIQELMDADLILIAFPVYNWNIPSTLKSWVDHVVRCDYTFREFDEGMMGGLSKKHALWPLDRQYNPDKRVVVMCSAGAVEPLHMTKYIHDIFGFMGVNNIVTIGSIGQELIDECQERCATEAKKNANQLANVGHEVWENVRWLTD